MPKKNKDLYEFCFSASGEKSTENAELFTEGIKLVPAKRDSDRIPSRSHTGGNGREQTVVF